MKSNIMILITAIILSIGAPSSNSQATETATQLLPNSRKTCDPALATSVTAAIFGHKEKKIVLIDVRSKAEFEQYHIPGSLNIALHAIKTKTWLKAKPIVLVNQGYALNLLVDTCKKLNTMGFKASILAGGLCAWKARGKRLTGDPFAQKTINRITAQRFHQQIQYTHQVLIDASETQLPQSKALIPQATHIALLKTEQDLAKVKKVFQQRASSSFSTLVVFTTTGKENDRIERHLAEAGVHKVFFLQGGLKAYEQYLSYILLARQPKERRKLSTGNCKNCVQQ